VFFLLTVAMNNTGRMLKELAIVPYLLHRSSNIKLYLRRKKTA
jgi:hypothetical protein